MILRHLGKTFVIAGSILHILDVSPVYWNTVSTPSRVFSVSSIWHWLDKW